MYQDLSMRHDWLVKNAIVNLRIIKKCTSGNLMSPLGAQNKDSGTASQMVLTGVILRLHCRLPQLGACSRGSRTWTSALHRRCY